jgi:hypothetical protein
VCDSAAAALEAIGTAQAITAVKLWQADEANFDPEAFLEKWTREHGTADE